MLRCGAATRGLRARPRRCGTWCSLGQEQTRRSAPGGRPDGRGCPVRAPSWVRTGGRRRLGGAEQGRVNSGTPKCCRQHRGAARAGLPPGVLCLLRRCGSAPLVFKRRRCAAQPPRSARVPAARPALPAGRSAERAANA